MADDPTTSQDNRATVAQTLAEVRGLRDLFKAEIYNIKERFDAVAGLPVAVAELKAQQRGDVAELRATDADQEDRITKLERARSAGAEWRRTHLPALIISALALVASIVLVITQLH